MGVRILHDRDSDQAVLYCSTSDWGFGPVFQADARGDACERAERFLGWLRERGIDPRIPDRELEQKYAEWGRADDELTECARHPGHWIAAPHLCRSCEEDAEDESCA